MAQSVIYLFIHILAFFLLCKVNEPRKPADRKAVRKAYENALQYESQVNGPDGADAAS